MSYPTQPAYIHIGDWDAETASHPAMKFMENFTRQAIDARGWESGTQASEWHTSDFTLYKANSEVFSGAEESWSKGIPGTYAPFKAHLHEPNFLVCWETKEGWESTSVLCRTLSRGLYLICQSSMLLWWAFVEC